MTYLIDLGKQCAVAVGRDEMRTRSWPIQSHWAPHISSPIILTHREGMFTLSTSRIRSIVLSALVSRSMQVLASSSSRNPNVHTLIKRLRPTLRQLKESGIGFCNAQSPPAGYIKAIAIMQYTKVQSQSPARTAV